MRDLTIQLTRHLRIAAILAVTLVAAAVRLRAAVLLPIDYDEDDYLRAAQLYASVIKNGPWQEITNINFNQEHPVLGKLVYAFMIARLPPAPVIPEEDITAPAVKSLPQPHLSYARILSALLGTLAVFLLACMDPLAGLFLALHTFTIKYTSHMLLEALPALTSAIAVVAYQRSQVDLRKRWLLLSAIALGVTVASKYAYGVAGVAILLYWIYSHVGVSAQSRQYIFSLAWKVALWIALAAAVFLAADPYLWPAPVERLMDSVRYHIDFSQGYLVRIMHFPFYMPLVWLFQWVPWHPELFPVGIDPIVAALATLGFVGLFRKYPLYATWLATGLIFLFIWPTKWPQYILIITFPWSLAASQGVREVLDPTFQLRLRRVWSRIAHPGAVTQHLC